MKLRLLAMTANSVLSPRQMAGFSCIDVAFLPMACRHQRREIRELPRQRNLNLQRIHQEFLESVENLSKRHSRLKRFRRKITMSLSPSQNREIQSPTLKKSLEQLESMGQPLGQANGKLEKVKKKLDKMSDADKVGIGASATEVRQWLDEIDALLKKVSSELADVITREGSS